MIFVGTRPATWHIRIMDLLLSCRAERRPMTAMGGFPTFTPRLSDDKVAPFSAVRAIVRMLLSPASYRRRNGAAGR
jgi:hypothetical protein